jgi:hypothetical protein
MSSSDLELYQQLDAQLISLADEFANLVRAGGAGALDDPGPDAAGGGGGGGAGGRGGGGRRQVPGELLEALTEKLLAAGGAWPFGCLLKEVAPVGGAPRIASAGRTESSAAGAACARFGPLRPRTTRYLRRWPPFQQHNATRLAPWPRRVPPKNCMATHPKPLASHASRPPVHTHGFSAQARRHAQRLFVAHNQRARHADSPGAPGPLSQR